MNETELGRLVEDPERLEELVSWLQPEIDRLGERDFISLRLRTSEAPERKGALEWLAELVRPLFSREA